ncbi:MAG TPA: AAA family ATPase, partial [Chloroflexota bacterium]|nr:AAA family ATPase [Chloroflexota bacterium]
MIVIRRLAASHYKGLIDVSLRLPERGSVLIEGRNEAGKSTLFDAVHFGLYGRPLVGDQPDAIHYGADQAVVELDLQVDNTELKLRRALRQTAKTLRAEADLEVRRRTGEDPSDVEVEQVKGAAAVNTRIQLELGGLTAEALLNSCLVAQKQLGRLEELARGSREAALTVLLNLGKLSDVHQRLRVKPEDDEQLRRARARVELARVTEQLAVLETRRAALERARRLAELRAVLDDLALLAAAQAELNAEAERLMAELGKVRTSLADVDRARNELAAWQRLADLAARLEALRLERADTEARLAALGEAAGALPERRAALVEAQATRAAAQALLDARSLGESLTRESERLAARVAERAELTSRCERLNDELTRLRTQHRAVQAQLQQLAPLTTQLEASRARQRELAALQREVSAVLQERAVVDDLAVRVKDVDVADDRQSLLVRLLVDHPVTGALAIRLRLWQGGGELLDVRGNRAAAARAERCLERAAALKLDVTTLDALPQAIAAVLQSEGERQAELSTAAGRREGLQGQLALLERNGKERKHELEQCRLSLERDSDETLAAQRAEVERRAEEAEREAARLLSALEVTLGDAALDDPREAAQRRVD